MGLIHSLFNAGIHERGDLRLTQLNSDKMTSVLSHHLIVDFDCRDEVDTA